MGTLVSATPVILVETAVEAAVAAGLIRCAARSRAEGWFTKLFDRTVWKGILLIAIAAALGVVVRMIDPSADTVGEALARLMGA